MKKLLSKKQKKGSNPCRKAQSVIEEIEELKRVEQSYYEAIKQGWHHQERKRFISSSRDKSRHKRSYRRQGRSVESKRQSKSQDSRLKSSEHSKSKAKSPTNWTDVNADLEILAEGKAKDRKSGSEFYDFRRQFLFQAPSTPLRQLPIKCATGKEKLIPVEYIRYTTNNPKISYSIKESMPNDVYSRICITQYVPKSFQDSIHKIITSSTITYHDVPKLVIKKWYPKSILKRLEDIADCKVLESSMGLSFLQNYSDEEDGKEDNSNVIAKEELPPESKADDSTPKIVSNDEKCKSTLQEQIFKEKLIKGKKQKKKKRKDKKKSRSKNKRANKSLKDCEKETNCKTESQTKTVNIKCKEIKRKCDDDSNIEKIEIVKRKNVRGKDKKNKLKRKKAKAEKQNKSKKSKDVSKQEALLAHSDKKDSITFSAILPCENASEIPRDNFDVKSRTLSAEKDLGSHRSSLEIPRDNFDVKSRTLSAEKDLGSHRSSLKSQEKPLKRKKLSDNFKSNSSEKSPEICQSVKIDKEVKVKCIAEKELGTPDTEEYYSNWESDAELPKSDFDHSNSINESWNSNNEEEILGLDGAAIKKKVFTNYIQDQRTYKRESHSKKNKKPRNKSTSPERNKRFKKETSLEHDRKSSLHERSTRHLEVSPPRNEFNSPAARDDFSPFRKCNEDRKRSRRSADASPFLEMPLNIRNSRNYARGRFDERYSQSPESRTSNSKAYFMFSDNTWEKDDYLTIKTEEIRLEEERRTLMEERRKLEIEKRRFEELEWQMYHTRMKDFVPDKKGIELKDLDDEKRHNRHKKQGVKDKTDTSAWEESDQSEVFLSKQKMSKWQNEEPRLNQDIAPSKVNQSRKFESKFESDSISKKGNKSKSRWEPDDKKSKESERPKEIKVKKQDEPMGATIKEESLTDNLNVSPQKSVVTKKSNKPEALENEYEKFMQALGSEFSGPDEKLEKLHKRKKKVKVSKKNKKKKAYSRSASQSSEEELKILKQTRQRRSKKKASSSSNSSSSSTTSSSTSSSDLSSTSSDLSSGEEISKISKKRKVGTCGDKITKRTAHDHDKLFSLHDNELQKDIQEGTVLIDKLDAPQKGVGANLNIMNLSLPELPQPAINALQVPQPVPSPKVATNERLSDESIVSNMNTFVSLTKTESFVAPVSSLTMHVLKEEPISPERTKINLPNLTFTPMKRNNLVPINVLDLEMQTDNTTLKREIEKEEIAVKPISNSKRYFASSSLNISSSISLGSNDRSNQFITKVVGNDEQVSTSVEGIKVKDDSKTNLSDKWDHQLEYTDRHRQSVSPRRHKSSPERRRGYSRLSYKKSTSRKSDREPSPKRRDRERSPRTCKSTYGRSTNVSRKNTKRHRDSNHQRCGSSSPTWRDKRKRSPVHVKRPTFLPSRQQSHSPKRGSISREFSPKRFDNDKPKLEPIHETLQRIAGVDKFANCSPLSSPLHGFKRSVADSTISDEQLLQCNSEEYSQSPAYNSEYFKSSPSPRRMSLDERINQALGLEHQQVKPITTIYSTYDYPSQYFDEYQYQHFDHINENYKQSRTRDNSNLKVVQIGNVLQVVPTEDVSYTKDAVLLPPQPPPRSPPPPPPPLPPSPIQQHQVTNSAQKIVQVGNMLQIVPTAILPKAVPETQTSSMNSPAVQEPFVAETLLDQKNERRIEKENRRQAREKKRKDKEKKRKEKEKRRQLRSNLQTEAMIKQALLKETEEEPTNDIVRQDVNKDALLQWPPAPQVVVTTFKGKGILCTSRIGLNEDLRVDKRKSVKFSDGVAPGEGTSPSGGEELSSPPFVKAQLPKEKRYIKTKVPKNVKLSKKKKVKVKVIRQQQVLEEDDNEEDSLPPPPPPPGSPPPHIFPARIKQPIINNVHPQVIANSISTNHQQINSYSAPIYRFPLQSQPVITHHWTGVPPPPHSIPSATSRIGSALPIPHHAVPPPHLSHPSLLHQHHGYSPAMQSGQRI